MQLLAGGHEVRTTIRTPGREAEVRSALDAAGAGPLEKLSFAQADLTSDEGWPEAVAGCDFVLHVASPFPSGVPKHEDELIMPAREGALRVLRAARDAGVKRVVMTSSFAAIGYGHKEPNRTFTEEDWTDVNGEHVSAYAKSKTLAERAAWDFIGRRGRAGARRREPGRGPRPRAGPRSVDLDRAGSAAPGPGDAGPAPPDLRAGRCSRRGRSPSPCDERPGCKGRAVPGRGGRADVDRGSRACAARPDGRVASHVPTRVLPDWVVRAAAMADPSLKQLAPELGKVKRPVGDKARRVLGWQPRSNEECIVGTAESLGELGLLKHAKAA